MSCTMILKIFLFIFVHVMWHQCLISCYTYGADKIRCSKTRGVHQFLDKRGRVSHICRYFRIEAFVKWLDGELSSLVDERSVLKHFPLWPEQKTDALREASCNYRDLKNLESEVSSFEGNPKEPLALALKKILALQDRRACTKLECSVA